MVNDSLSVAAATFVNPKALNPCEPRNRRALRPHTWLLAAKELRISTLSCDAFLVLIACYQRDSARW